MLRFARAAAPAALALVMSYGLPAHAAARDHSMVVAQAESKGGEGGGARSGGGGGRGSDGSGVSGAATSGAGTPGAKSMGSGSSRSSSANISRSERSRVQDGRRSGDGDGARNRGPNRVDGSIERRRSENRTVERRQVVRSDGEARRYADRRRDGDGARSRRGGGDRPWRSGRRFHWGPGVDFWFYDGYYYGDCSWLREKARDTGSRYWRERFRQCREAW